MSRIVTSLIVLGIAVATAIGVYHASNNLQALMVAAIGSLCIIVMSLFTLLSSSLVQYKER